jgi:hypothetical protein
MDRDGPRRFTVGVIPVGPDHSCRSGRPGSGGPPRNAASTCRPSRCSRAAHSAATRASDPRCVARSSALQGWKPRAPPQPRMCSYGSSSLSFQCAPRAEATHTGRKSLAATALQSCKPAGRNAQERLQNRHVTRAVRGICVGDRNCGRRYCAPPGAQRMGRLFLAENLLVPQGGFEPSTYRLRSDCSAVELLRRPERVCIKLLPNKPPPVEEAQSAVAYRSALLFDGCPGQARA